MGRRQYKSEDGCYLSLDERAEGIFIGWYIPDEEDFGAYVGEDSTLAKTPPKAKDEWECWMAHKVVEPFADDRVARGFCFETVKKARTALRAANEALLGGVPWPEWAVKAKEAGWTPPKGWRP